MSLDVLSEVARRYGTSPSELAELDGFESFIYETDLGGTPAILRVGHSRRRPAGQVLSELDWLVYLADHDIGVAKPLRSTSGTGVEAIDDRHGDEFIAAAFRCASGRSPTADDWAPDLWERYGRLLGRMHAATRHYLPTGGIERRPHWDDDTMLDVFAFLPEDDIGARTSLEAVLEHVAALPRDPSAYGLIHQDAHAGNFFVDGETITLFDFDDCCYSWFVNDLAIVLFYALSWVGFEDDPDYVERFWRWFSRGYRNAHDLDRQWLVEIPWFMKLRELDTYAIVNRSMDPNHIDDPWARRFILGRRDRVNQGAPVVDLDFVGLG